MTPFSWSLPLHWHATIISLNLCIDLVLLQKNIKKFAVSSLWISYLKVDHEKGDKVFLTDQSDDPDNPLQTPTEMDEYNEEINENKSSEKKEKISDPKHKKQKTQLDSKLGLNKSQRSRLNMGGKDRTTSTSGGKSDIGSPEPVTSASRLLRKPVLAGNRGKKSKESGNKSNSGNISVAVKKPAENCVEPNTQKVNKLDKDTSGISQPSQDNDKVDSELTDKDSLKEDTPKGVDISDSKLPVVDSSKNTLVTDGRRLSFTAPAALMDSPRARRRLLNQGTVGGSTGNSNISPFNKNSTNYITSNGKTVKV